VNIGYLYGFPAYPPQGGNATHVYQLVRWFVKRGHVVHTIGDSQLSLALNHGATAPDVDRFLRSIDLLYVRIDGWYLNRSPVKKAAMKRARVPVVWEINAPANEMLAFSLLGAAGDGRFPLPKSLRNVRRRLHALGHLPGIYRDEFTRRLYARKVQAAICISSAMERYAHESLRIGRTCVLPNGADPELCSPEREPVTLDPRFRGWFKVLYAGSPLYPWQGLDILQRVVDFFQGSGHKILFLLLVNQMSPQIPKGENVLVFERIGYLDLPRYVLAADVCLCLCHDFSWSKWGFHGSPTKLFEYMACGKPVIASRVGQLQTVVEDGINGLLVDNTAEDVVKKILLLYESRQRLSGMGTRSREKVLGCYNWERVADATLDLFASLGRSDQDESAPCAGDGDHCAAAPPG
jgi:glycosyltransferase involved in cell wall biosynthesis